VSRHLVDGRVTPEFGAEMARLYASRPSARPDSTTTRAYADLLGDLDIETVARAMRLAALTVPGTFLPGVPEIRQFAAPSLSDAPMLAWTLLQRAAEDVGAYVSLQVDDACAAFALVTVFGSWPEFCAQEDGAGMAARRHEFAAAYREAVRMPPESLPSTRLAGLCEQSGNYPQATLGGHVWRADVNLLRGDVRLVRDEPGEALEKL
jgi:hypothetical protein